MKVQKSGRLTKWKGKVASLAPSAVFAVLLSVIAPAGAVLAQDIAITGGGHLTVR